MATRLTYTTGSRSAELDRAFEAALAEAREREAEPLTHLVGGREVAAGEAFDREDPSRREQVASRAREGAESLRRRSRRRRQRSANGGGCRMPSALPSCGRRSG